MKSITETKVLLVSADVRNPRPNCCKNRILDSVGRKIKIVSIEGKSVPSLNKSTENITSISPEFNWLSASPRLTSEPLCTDTALIPRAENH